MDVEVLVLTTDVVGTHIIAPCVICLTQRRSFGISLVVIEPRVRAQAPPPNEPCFLGSPFLRGVFCYLREICALVIVLALGLVLGLATNTQLRKAAVTGCVLTYHRRYSFAPSRQ